MNINQRVHPEWLEIAKLILLCVSTSSLLFALCLYLLSDNPYALLIFGATSLISAAKHLLLIGTGCVIALTIAVYIEHALCKKYCVGWKNHKVA